jgi:excisionase family DNA binding protein
VTTQVVHTVNEAAAILRCSPSAIYEMVAAGKLRCYIIGKRGIRITADALDDYMRGAA